MYFYTVHYTPFHEPENGLPDAQAIGIEFLALNTKEAIKKALEIINIPSDADSEIDGNTGYITIHDGNQQAFWCIEQDGELSAIRFKEEVQHYDLYIGENHYDIQHVWWDAYEEVFVYHNGEQVTGQLAEDIIEYYKD